ncbi:MAG: hypothetical protein DYG96_10205 [Chlorobi bacterium CHB2]|nr:hypothetical protein [Chlorobi bacterium CHB2]
MKNILSSYVKATIIISNLHWIYGFVLLYNSMVSYAILLMEQESHDSVNDFFINTIILCIHSISSSVIFIIMLKIKLKFYNYMILYCIIRYVIQVIMLNGRFSNPSLSWLFDIALFGGLFVFLLIKQKDKAYK